MQVSRDRGSATKESSTPDALSYPKSEGGLTLEAAIARALTQSPKIRSSEASRQSSQGELRQAGVWQNPELEVAAENIAGKGDYRGFDSAEVTYGVSQLVEIGGKRDARVEMAKRGVDLANYDHQATQLDLIRDITQAFVEAVAAFEEVRQAREQQSLANDVLQSVSRRVEAAREPLIQKSKANVALATSRIALEKAERTHDAARKVLANLMGANDDDAVNKLDTSGFYAISSPVTTAAIKEMLERNPDITRWKPAVAKSEAALELEKANAIPDPRINAGVREFRESNSRAFLVGISIPIPVLNGNQGNISKARAELTKAAVDQRVSELQLSSELAKSLQAQKTAYTQATTLKDAILPEAEHAFTLSRQGYLAGKFAYLEVLDAQRTLSDARLQYIEALKEFHIQRSNVERLTATHLSTKTALKETHDQE
ncbi:MAG: TolC family protein [Bdellovibrionales bacterium]